MDPFSYDHTLNSECLMEIPKTINAGEGFQELKINGNRGNRKVVERVDLQKGNIYSITAWVKLRNKIERRLRMTLRGKNVRYIDGGQVMAKKGCWSLLKGGLTVNVSVPVDILFKSDGLAAEDIIVQNVRLQRFNKIQWRLKQDQVIEKVVYFLYMRSALDTLGSLGFPVWLTEVDMAKCPDQVKYMEDILREAYSHPAVKGIILYAGPEVSGFDKLTLADKDFNNTEAGNLIEKLLQEWQEQPAEIRIQNHEHNDDEEGRIIGSTPEISLLHGHYTVTVTNPSMKNFSSNFSFEVNKEMGHPMRRDYPKDIKMNVIQAVGLLLCTKYYKVTTIEFCGSLSGRSSIIKFLK